MPDRIVRSGILTSDSVNKLSWAAEVFYRRLMSVADDYGRFDGRPAVLRATLYPLKLDRVSEREITTWIRDCEEAGLLTVYTVDGKEYLEINKFDQRLRAKNSKWPPPPSSAVTCQHMSANATEANTESDAEANTEGESAQAPPGLDPDAWKRWLQYRKEIRKPLKPASYAAAMKKLAAYGDQQLAVVEQSIANGWQGLFDLKNGGPHATRERADTSAVGRVRAANGIRR